MNPREFNMRVEGHNRNRRSELESSALFVAYMVTNFPSFGARRGRAKSVEDVIGLAPWKREALKATAKRKRREAEEAEQS